MDNRIKLYDGYRLTGASRTYTIEKYISAGSNSMVYQAGYRDSLMPEHLHTVLVKELYPLDEEGRILRDDQMGLVIPEDARGLFEYHKASFLQGNQAHLELSEEGKGHIAENLDSFEANHTLYTILTARTGEVLAGFLKGGKGFGTLTEAALCFRSILEGLKPFHSRRLLHLDISPDNIFLLSSAEEKGFSTEVLLLDFNSVYSMDKKLLNECQYYLGKQDYMAPEVRLHNENELGPWTDVYSACAVFYEILTGQRLPQDRELLDTRELVSPYTGLLLHEKESSAGKVNAILDKGLRIVTGERYQDTSEVLADIQELLDILNGDLRIRMEPIAEKRSEKKKGFPGRGWRKGAAVLLVAVAAAGGFAAGCLMGPRQSMENTKLDLTQFPLETDDSVILTEHDVRYPLENNILNMQVHAESAVRILLKDYEHKRDETDIFETYSLFSFYQGREDKRGWQNAGLTYDFFTTEDNTMHMVLPFQDTNDLDLDYIGVVLQNFNYSETEAILDITKCTLTDGEGNSYEITDLVGSHLLFFDEERFQQNLITDQNQDFVTSFEEIRGGDLTVDAQICFLDDVLEVTWESEDPDIASVDERGRIKGVRQGWTRLTATIRDKDTGETRSTQMMVNVTAQP